MAAFTAGDRIGVRGPYGNAFQLEGPSVLAVGGGSGMASMIAAIEAFAQQGARVVTAVGARTAAELLFVERANAAGEMHIATDDGSRGSAGFVPTLAEKLLARESFAQVITCGPERMMAAVVDLARQKGSATPAPSTTSSSAGTARSSPETSSPSRKSSAGTAGTRADAEFRSEHGPSSRPKAFRRCPPDPSR